MGTWYDDAFFLLHFAHDYSPHDEPPALSGFDPEALERWLRRIRPDALAWTAKGHQGYVPYPSRCGNQLPALAGTPHHDALALCREITQHLGIRFVVGYSGLVDDLAVNWRPGWLRIRPDGTSYPNRAICPNSGYVEELMLPQLEEILDYYQPDGVWTEAENWTVAPCWCSACESEFQMLHERSAPRDRSDPLWPQWLQFHRDSFQRYLDRVGRYLHDRNAELVYTSNGAGCTFQPEPLPRALDRLVWDISPAFSLRQAGMEARFLDARGLPFDLITWSECSARPWRQGRLPALPLYPKSFDHLAQEGAVLLASGARWSVWIRLRPDDSLPERPLETTARVAEWARERRPWCLDDESVAWVAVLHGDAAHRKAGNGLYDPGPSLDRIRGAHQALLELHAVHDIVGEDELRRRLPQYRVVLLPEQIDLAPTLEEALTEWVRAGGRLVATGKLAPRLQEDVPVFALEELFGVQWTGRQAPEGVALHRGAPLRIAAPVCHVRAIEATTVAPLLASDRDDAPATEFPAITRHPFGEGEAFYIAADLCAAYHRHQYPGLRELLGDVLEQALPEPPLLTTAPPTVEITLRRREEELRIHLVQHDPGKSLAQNSPFIESAPPTPPFSLTLRLDAEPRRVRLQPGDLEPEWSWSGRALTLFVPPVQLHALAVVELAPAPAEEGTESAAAEVAEPVAEIAEPAAEVAEPAAEVAEPAAEVAEPARAE